MNPTFQKIEDRFIALDEMFRARSLRERAILAVGFAALVFFSIDSFAIRPIAKSLDQIRREAMRTESEITRLQDETKALAGPALTAEQRRLADAKQLLLRQLKEIDTQISAQISQLVPPEAVVSVLEEMLAPSQRLRLLSVQSLSPHRLGSEPLAAAGATTLRAIPGLYRHGLRIEIEGDFAATVEYLRQVEESPWNLLWDRFEYRVTQFPTGTTTIDLHTISQQEEWIGV